MVIGLIHINLIQINWNWSYFEMIESKIISQQQESVMARNWLGNRKITKEDMYTKSRVTDADVRGEYIKMVIWLALGYGYFHFVVMGWTW